MLIPLPEPAPERGMTLETAIRNRRSIRDFRPDPLDPGALSRLLWSAQGITGEGGLRAAPSAGALYPLETYVLTAEGVSHYEPGSHALRRVAEVDVRPAVRSASFDQGCITAAPAVLLFAAVFERTCAEYGAEGRKYVHMDAGHAAQNVLLQATALGLAGVPVAAFDADVVARLLSLPSGETPLYMVPLGFPV